MDFLPGIHTFGPFLSIASEGEYFEGHHNFEDKQGDVDSYTK
jgi:hypothetical protein